MNKEKLVEELETLLKYFKSDEAKKELRNILLPHLKWLQKETAKAIKKKFEKEFKIISKLKPYEVVLINKNLWDKEWKKWCE